MLTLDCPAFAAGESIPKKYAYLGEGDNLSPPLAWGGIPNETRTLAILVEDPDAPNPARPGPEPWVHWLLFNVPATTAGLAEGEPGAGTPGMNDFDETGWGGPLPPEGSGPHRYFFHIYALDTELELPEGANKQQLLDAMQGHVLGESSIYGTYERARSLGLM